MELENGGELGFELGSLGENVPVPENMKMPYA